MAQKQADRAPLRPGQCGESSRRLLRFRFPERRAATRTSETPRNPATRRSGTGSGAEPADCARRPSAAPRTARPRTRGRARESMPRRGARRDEEDRASRPRRRRFRRGRTFGRRAGSNRRPTSLVPGESNRCPIPRIRRDALPGPIAFARPGRLLRKRPGARRPKAARSRPERRPSAGARRASASRGGPAPGDGVPDRRIRRARSRGTVFERRRTPPRRGTEMSERSRSRRSPRARAGTSCSDTNPAAGPAPSARRKTGRGPRAGPEPVRPRAARGERPSASSRATGAGLRSRFRRGNLRNPSARAEIRAFRETEAPTRPERRARPRFRARTGSSRREFPRGGANAA